MILRFASIDKLDQNGMQIECLPIKETHLPEMHSKL